MSKLQTAADYHREIAEVRAMIEEEERMNEMYGADPASLLMIRSLRNRLSALTSELEGKGERLGVQELAVVLEGRPVHGHSVDVSFLSTILSDFQRVVEAMHASAAGVASRVAALPKKVVQQGTLRFAGSFDGSFGMRLETVDHELDLDIAGSITHTIDAFVRLLDTSESADDLLDKLEPLNSRARARYIELLDHLSNNGADIRVEWPAARGLRTARLRHKQAGKLRERLENVQEQEEIKSYRGTLDGALTNRAIFEFRTEGGDVFSGRIGPGVEEQLRSFRYQDPAIATITTRRVKDMTTGKTGIFYRLEQLKPVKEESRE